MEGHRPDDDAVEAELASQLETFHDQLLGGQFSGDSAQATPQENINNLSNTHQLLRRLEMCRQRVVRANALSGEFSPVHVTSPGAKLGRYEIHGELGRGAYGVVYLAYDPLLQRSVALKVPRPETVFSCDRRERFLREARAVAALEHPNLVPIYEVGQIGDVCFLVMAYCPGRSLAARLKDTTAPFPPRKFGKGKPSKRRRR